MKGPIATIAIPVYNGERFIAQAIESVLRQTRSDFILNIFDNCSTDKTAEIIHSFVDARLHYFCNETNIGMLPNWKKALESSQTPYCGILFADDFYKKDFLEKTVSVMESYPQVGIVSGAYEHYSQDNQLVFSGTRGLRGLISAEEYHRWVYQGKYIPSPSEILFRTQSVKQVGGYDIYGLNWIVDTDMYLRMTKAGDAAYFLKDVISCRRSWPGNSSAALSASPKCFEDMYIILSRHDDPLRIDSKTRRWAYDFVWQFLRTVSWGLLSKGQRADFEKIFTIFQSCDPRFKKWYSFLAQWQCRVILIFDFMQKSIAVKLKSLIRRLIKFQKCEGNA